MEFIKSQNIIGIKNVTQVTVISNYPNAWYTAFRNTLKSSINPYDENMVHMSGNRVYIDFSSNKPSNFDLKYVEVYAQVAPGWVE